MQTEWPITDYFFAELTVPVVEIGRGPKTLRALRSGIMQLNLSQINKTTVILCFSFKTTHDGRQSGAIFLVSWHARGLASTVPGSDQVRRPRGGSDVHASFVSYACTPGFFSRRARDGQPD